MDDEELNDLFGMDDGDQDGEEVSDKPSSADHEGSGSEPEESSSETAGGDGGVFAVTEEELDELFEDDGGNEDLPEPEDEETFEEDDEDFYEEFVDVDCFRTDFLCIGFVLCIDRIFLPKFSDCFCARRTCSNDIIKLYIL